MAKIKLLSGGSSLLPEGTITLQVVDVEYNTKKGELDIHFETAQGAKHKERFFLKTFDNEVNEGATRAFSFMAKTILQDMDLEEVDPEDLIDGFITVDVRHEESDSLKDDGTPFVNARMGNFQPADDFDSEPAKKKSKPKKAEPVEESDDDDYLSFLED